jgi:integral membrane sensor domain MASE1
VRHLVPEFFAQSAALAGVGILLLVVGAILYLQTREAPAGRPSRRPLTDGALLVLRVSGAGLVTSAIVACLLGAAGMLLALLGMLS